MHMLLVPQALIGGDRYNNEIISRTCPFIQIADNPVCDLRLGLNVSPLVCTVDSVV